MNQIQEDGFADYILGRLIKINLYEDNMTQNFIINLMVNKCSKMLLMNFGMLFHIQRKNYKKIIKKK